MTRPTYETERDRAAEAAVAALCEHTWPVAAARCPRRYPCDYVLYSRRTGRARALLEIKRRKHALSDYDDLILSASKVVELCTFAEFFNVSAVLVVDFDGAVAFTILRRGRYALRQGGRTDRGDEQDVEPVCAIPTADFSPLSS